MAYDFESDAETQASAPTPPRAPRARRRRRRRGVAFVIGFLVVVALGVVAVAVLFGWDPGDSSDSSLGPSVTTAGVTTTTAPPLPPPKAFKVTDGVNVRAGPATSAQVVTTVQKGFEVLVVCVVDGEAVNGPAGSTNQWLRVMVDNKTGYVTAAYVDTGPAISDTTQIGRCPPS
jgi:uncharacterized protein YgiM (DUF1202 family)